MTLSSHPADVAVMSHEADAALATAIMDRLEHLGLAANASQSGERKTLVVWTTAASQSDDFIRRVEQAPRSSLLHARFERIELPFPFDKAPSVEVYDWRPRAPHDGWRAMIELLSGSPRMAPGPRQEAPPQRSTASRPAQRSAGILSIGTPYVLTGVALFLLAALLYLSQHNLVEDVKIREAFWFTPWFAAPIFALLMSRRAINWWRAIMAVIGMTAIHYGAIFVFLALPAPLGWANDHFPHPLPGPILLGISGALAGVAAGAISYLGLASLFGRPRLAIGATPLKVVGLLAVISFCGLSVAVQMKDGVGPFLQAVAIFPVWQFVYGLAVLKLVDDMAGPVAERLSRRERRRARGSA